MKRGASNRPLKGVGYEGPVRFNERVIVRPRGPKSIFPSLGVRAGLLPNRLDELMRHFRHWVSSNHHLASRNMIGLCMTSMVSAAVEH